MFKITDLSFTPLAHGRIGEEAVLQSDIRTILLTSLAEITP